MQGYKQWIFNLFGKSGAGQTVGAVVIGALTGLVAALHGYAGNWRTIGVFTVGGAGLGLLGALALLVAEYGKRNVAVRSSRVLRVVFWILFAIGCLIVAVQICNVIDGLLKEKR